MHVYISFYVFMYVTCMRLPICGLTMSVQEIELMSSEWAESTYKPDSEHKLSCRDRILVSKLHCFPGSNSWLFMVIGKMPAK